MSEAERIEAATERAEAGNLETGAAKLKAQGKLFVRDRLALLLDGESFVEDGLLANTLATDLPADGVVTGRGRVEGRPVCVMANDPTVKAGSWGARTVEKIVRLTEYALEHELPVFYLVDSAGARITDQVELFPGRRGAGRIFYNEVRLSGRVPQICCLFGPSAAGGAYIPAFCDVVFMVEGNASMYLGSPRMAEMVVGELTDLEEMGGARMHATVSGCGDNLVSDDAAAIEAAKAYFSYLPGSWREAAPYESPRAPSGELTAASIPESDRLGYSVYTVIDALLDDASFFELKPLYAPELVVGWGRLEGRSIGIVANNPASRGGVLFTNSADKAARFIWCADAFNVPLLFLADVPGFMIGTSVEREGIIRHGAKMITAVSEATVPKISVILRKAYGAGLYAMAGPAFAPDACLALPSAKIAVMGPEPAVNAVYANRIAAIEDGAEREAYVADRRREYETDVDLLRLASDLVVDAVVQPEQLRSELVRRFALAESKTRSVHRPPPRRAAGVTLTSQPAGEPGGAEGEDLRPRDPPREPDGSDPSSSATPVSAPRPARPPRGTRPVAPQRAGPPGQGGPSVRRPPAAGSTPPESGEGRPARRPPAGGPTTPPGRPTGRRPDAAARPTDRPSPKRRRPEAPQEPLSAGEPAEESGSDGEERQAKAPWHFKFIVVGSVVYLGWRLYQGISWLAHHI